ncbi:MAG: UDP-3-O-(3-hydroxymyristoyl)glucosamine N-acyltransferase, partial [Alphaproteobacteria bacterium]|nr:UDP-3-O-(3-hydroxymyristoyl)glucosamine N-acyltransferase [Alphaproteobacteria bacterium]
LGARCDIRANAVIERGVVMGDDCIVGATATVSHCVAGNKVYIYPGAHIGQDGFGFAMSVKGPVKVPQLGRVIIGNDVEIGSGTTVDRGAMGDTVISDGCRIDNLVQVAHNVKLGRCCVIVAQVGIAGSCEFSDFVVAGGQVGFAGHLKIGAGAQIAAQSGIMTDVAPGSILMGSPAVSRVEFMRQQIALQRLTKKKKED